MILYVLTFAFSFLLALYITPIMREAALRFGIMDHPDDNLKKHGEPVAYLGGLAVYLSFLVSLSLVYDFDKMVLGLLLGATIIVLLGLIDDFGFLSPQVKLVGQLIAVWVLIKSGIYVKLEFLPTVKGVPVVAYALSIFWLIGVANAFNIIDVMDGLAATVAAVASLVLFGVAFMNHRPTIAVLTLALAGSLFGFLRYNKPPAKIYLGDTGSLFIGLMLGSLAMIGSYTKNNEMSWAAPIVILGVPIFDTFLVMFLRMVKGRPVMFGSPDHYALRMRRMGLGDMTITLISGGATLLLGAAAFWMVSMKSDVHAFILCCALGVNAIIVAIWVGRVKMPYLDEGVPDSEEGEI